MYFRLDEQQGCGRDRRRSTGRLLTGEIPPLVHMRTTTASSAKEAGFSWKLISTLAAVAFAAIGAHYLRKRLQDKKVEQLQDKRVKLESAFLLIIMYRLHNPEDVDVFLKKWADLAKHCESSEPHTHAYEVGETGGRFELN